MGSKFFETVTKFPVLGNISNNSKKIFEEIKCLLNSGNVCYRSVQFRLPSLYLSKNKGNLNTQKDNFACFLYGGLNWSQTLKKECRLRVFEDGVPRRIFGPNRNEISLVEETAQ